MLLPFSSNLVSILSGRVEPVAALSAAVHCLWEDEHWNEWWNGRRASTHKREEQANLSVFHPRHKWMVTAADRFSPEMVGVRGTL